MRTLLFLLFLPLLFLTVLSGQSSTDLHLSPRTCTASDGTVYAAESGYLSVMENRDDTVSADIPVSFVRIKSTAAEPAPPIFYLEGGPGSPATWMADRDWFIDRWASVLAHRDLVLIDQRGTGIQAQRITYIRDTPLPKDLLVDASTVAENLRSMVAPAKAAWAERGVDYRGYTSLASARDLDDLRRAMGLDEVALYGFSYGTHLGQVYMKYFGDHVDRAVLVGVEGLDDTFKLPQVMDEQFRKLAKLAAADPVVGGDYPDLIALYRRVADRLRKAPITLTLRDLLTGEDLELRVGKYALDYVLFRDLGDASDLPVIPRLLSDIERGYYDSFRWFLQKRLGANYGLHAMSVTTDLASGASTARRAEIEEQAKTSLFGNVTNGLAFALLDTFGASDLGPEFRAPFDSDIPTLLLSGDLDMNTPPRQAEALLRNLTHATHLVVENAGHEQIVEHPDIEAAIGRFLSGKEVGEVSASYPALKFIPVEGSREGVGHPALER